MIRALLALGLALALGLLLAFPEPPQAVAQEAAQPAPAPPQDELVDKVRKSIDKGVRYLERQQTPQGNWEGIVLNLLANLEGGATSLVTLALLNCGLKPEDRSVAKALDYLRTLPPRKTYVVALQTMVFAEARQAKDAPLIQRNADWLVDNAIGYQHGAGQLEGWSYPGNAVADNSNTQYALLGLYAAKQAGAKIDERIWKQIQSYYERHRKITNNQTAAYWRYHNGTFDDNPSFTMSVAGVCGLIIAGMGLDQSEQQLDEQTGVAARCGIYSQNTAVAQGMNWIGTNFTFDVVDKRLGKSDTYNFYGIERLGRLSGQRFIGKYDWYREGCERLVRMQDADGAFNQGKGLDGSGILPTSFALLFLSKGRTPILVSKFAWGEFQDRGAAGFAEIGGPGNGVVNWNRKHNDARHMVEFASKELFKGTPLAWQVYDIRRKPFDPEPAKGLSTADKVREEVGVLLQSPVVYINGHGALNFVGIGKDPLTIPEQILQRYVQEGGFIIAESCCGEEFQKKEKKAAGDETFGESFIRMMKRLFPENDFRQLPKEHAIWTMMPGVAPDDFPDLMGLERGCRTVAVYSPSPLAGYWEEHRFMPADGKRPKDRGEKAFCLSRNIIAYATGLELPKPRLTPNRLKDPTERDLAPPRSAFQPAQLRIGESEPAPAAMRNLMTYLRDTARLEVNLTPKFVTPYDTSLFAFKFMYLHGRKPLSMDDGELANIKSNLQTGGLLLADAACNGFESWKAFDKSFRDFCAKLFPDNRLEPIPPDDPIFITKRPDGSKVPLTTVKCRREKADGSGPEPERRDYAPLLEGVKIDGRWVIVYSKYDIGCALEGHKAADCMGHDKDSALKLAAGVVLYALKR